MALLHVDFFSRVLQMCVQMDVILPQDTKGQIGMEGKGAKNYPTLYLLHGLSDDHTIWQRRTSIERYVSNLGIAVVMPTTARCWYTDSPCGNYFTYVAKELPAVCREFFPNMSSAREETYIAGLSMGGYGAFKIAMSCPETFSAAASLSGVMDVMPYTVKTPQVFGVDTRGSDNDLFALSKKLAASGKPLPRLFQWCGTEDGFIKCNRDMRDNLVSLGYDLSYSESTGIHSWDYWDVQIQNVLKWLEWK